MKSLFVKILLWFGLAMVLVNIASFATGIFTERRFQQPRTLNDVDSPFQVSVQHHNLTMA